MKVLYFDYRDYLLNLIEKVFVNNPNSFYDEIIYKKYDLLIINFDFFNYLYEVKKFFSGSIIFLAAEMNENIYKKALMIGDYCYNYNELFKIPVRLEYLKNKIHNAKSGILKLNDFVINLNTKEVYKNRIPLKFTAAEKELLFFLLKNKNRFITKEEIIDSCENIDSIDSVKVIISSLRKKGLEIENQKNLGYKIKE
jgi:DNA-binding response OmpR family regulator